MDLAVEANALGRYTVFPKAESATVVKDAFSENVLVMGNINPTGHLLNGHTADEEGEVLQLLSDMAPYPNFILSTGCDLPQETPLENIHAFMRAGRNWRG